jgi:hypothetical protein
MTGKHPPIGPSAFAGIMAELADARRRQIRAETRLCKLMDYLGLDENGRRIQAAPEPHSHAGHGPAINTERY